MPEVALLKALAGGALIGLTGALLLLAHGALIAVTGMAAGMLLYALMERWRKSSDSGSREHLPDTA